MFRLPVPPGRLTRPLVSGLLLAWTGLAASPALAHAQGLPDLDLEWRWVDFGPESGLPGGVPRGLVEVGPVVWVQTDEGVAWYDGFEWHPVDVDGEHQIGTATSLAPDSAGGVILVQGGRIYRGDTTGVRQVKLPQNLQGSVLRAVPFSDGRILFSVDDPGSPRLFTLDDGAAAPTRGLPPLTRATGLWHARSGRVWAATEMGLFVWEGDRWTPRDPMGEDGGEEAWVMEGAGGTGLAWRVSGRGERGVFRFGRSGGFTHQASEGDNVLVAGDVVSDSLILAVYETGDVRVWDGSRWNTALLPPSRRGGVRWVHVTESRDYWFGSPRGLHLFRAGRSRYTVNRQPFPRLTNRINTILVAADSSLWLGTGRGILEHRRNPPAPRWIQQAGGISVGAVTGMAQDAQGRIWVTSGSDFQGALVRDQGQWRHLDADDGLDVGFVHRVFTEDDGTVWLASLGKGDGVDAGLYRWRDGEAAVSVLEERGIPATRVYAAARDPEGTLWLASYPGIYALGPSSSRFIPVGDTLGPNQSKLWDVAVDPSGKPWFALAPGLARGLVTIEGDTLVSVVPPGPEPVRASWSVVFDEDGALWTGTDGGLLRYSQGVWALFDESTGLPAVNVWPVARHTRSLLIGTRGGGLVSLNNAEAVNPPPRVAVRSLDVDGATARLEVAVHPYWGEVPAERVEIRTRLDGGPWSAFTTQRDLHLTKLSFGRHTVEVQSKGLFGQLSAPAVSTATVPFPIPFRPSYAIPIGFLLGALMVTRSMGARRRRKDEEALRLSEGRLRALVEGSYEAIGILDGQLGRFIDANSNALKLSGLDRSELLERDLLAISPTTLPHGEDAAQLFSSLCAKALGGAPQLVEWTLRGAEGQVIPCELHLSHLPSAGGSLFRVSLLDIRRRKVEETRRAELEEQLRQSQKLEAVGQLTGGVAHDFNNLLTVIHGNLEMLGEVAALDEEARGLVDDAIHAAERSSRLTQRLLAFSRRQALAPTALDLRTIVGELHGLLSRSLGETVHLVFAIPDGTWTVKVDRAQLESAILNLCLNSRDAMPQGGQIRLAATNVAEGALDPVLQDKLEPGAYVCVSVSDTGSGMAPEIQARAFDPFFTTKDVDKGTGLGLSMVYGFVSQSGGTVTIDSEPGRGTRISLYLPRDVGTSAGGADPDADAGLVRGRGESILLVEDDPDVARMLTQFLARLGYQAVPAADGPAALKVIAEGSHVDAMLTDLVLPGSMSGVEVAAGVRELAPDLPVLYMSGYSEDALFDGVRPEPEADVLRKPFDLPALAKKLRHTLDA